ncbi:MAG: EAL domain-containing protein [Spirulinaceae cyanobacterium]
MFVKLRQAVHSQGFEYALFGILVLESGVLAIQIILGDTEIHRVVSQVLVGLIIALLTLENGLGMVETWPRPWRYFYHGDHWLSFGLLLLLIQFPEHSYFALLRIPRALRLAKVTHRLNLFKGLVALKLMHQTWRSKATIHRHRQLLQVIFDRIPIILIIWEPGGTFQLANQAAQRILGWSPAQFLASELWPALYPEQSQYTRLQTWLQTANGQWREFRTHCLDTQIRDISWACLPLWDSLYLAIGQDITPQKQLEAQLRWQATHDALTQLLNRRAFEAELNRMSAKSDPETSSHILCYLDLDRFKIINDTCGHGAGDEALRQIATLLDHQLESPYTLARLGGDEFGLLLQDKTLAQAQRIAQTLLDAVKDYRFIWQGQSFTLGVSIGVVELRSTLPWRKDALVLADAACYGAKYHGRNCIHVYRPDDEELARQRGDRRWSHCLQTALERDRFYLYAQEIMPLSANPGRHFYEILLRLGNEEGQHLGAQGFLPAAERCDLMPDIDRWVIRHFLTVCLPMLREIHRNIQVNYTINLSGASLNSELFREFLYDLLQAHRDCTSLICFEITETVAIANLTYATAFMNRIKTLGCSFALDDFGSGMSSLHYLQSLPVDYLKIDGLFIKDIVHNPVHQVMVEGCHQIAHIMGLETMAEHVEDEATITHLRQIGIDYAQGYAIAQPNQLIPLEAL